jgi:hypothetical protein
MTIRHPNIFQRTYLFYLDGFRRMTVGKTLWKIIFIKLIIMFAVLKLFFFQNFLGTEFSTDEQRADYILNELTGPAQANNIFSNDTEKNND